MENTGVDDQLIIKFLYGKTNDEESYRVLDWLNQKHDNRLYYFNLKRIWQESTVNIQNEDAVNRSWERLKLRINTVSENTSTVKKRVRLNWNLKKFAVAASITVLFATSLFLGVRNYYITRESNNINKIIVPLGSRSKIILPDGSDVWLNSGSSITYNSNFPGRNRKIFLEGEAFFNVKHISTRSPFIVSAGDIEFKVLGTAFNVKCYPDEKTVETTLVEGKIEVIPNRGLDLEHPLFLLPNQKLTYIKKDNILKLAKADQAEQKEADNITGFSPENTENIQITMNINPEIYTSWKEEKLIFNGEKLENLVPKLERFYNVKISLEDESMKSYRYTGTLQEVTIEEVLRAIESTSPISFEMNKNQIILRMKKTINNITN